MRSEIKDYIVGLKLKNYKVSEELPFSNSGVAVYLKNPKAVYVDDDQLSYEPFIPMLNGNDVESTVQTVRVYLTSDAKQQPSDYSTVVASIRNARYIAPSEFFKRECDVSVSYENDLQVTEFEFRFTKLT